ncbi:hypothetical protein N2603_14635 [Bradyrhizobium huanghuaihaiense]|uniref:hypothetical protein n=1 Tax=Bradyrhizobium huanghuaihaiense TaxID=990078 RepID=UPI0021AA202E|nr:hypothetical protein [Bradyrhizobium sp. CB3035]UWU79646.1 hypothetical protein N2603_14635 [Bradyrhizobium sp. CB3035]
MSKTASQEHDDRMVCKFLRKDVMILEHAAATFWRRPASELLVIAAAGFDLKCLLDGHQRGGLCA